MKTFVACIFLYLFLSPFSSRAQQKLFRTTSGNMVINAEIADSTLRVRSDDILVLLDYSDASLKIKVDEATLQTGIDSVDKKLQVQQKKFVVYEGQFNANFINIDDKNQQHYKVEGRLNYRGKEYLVKGKATLKNLHNSEGIQALLGLTFDLNLDEMGIVPPIGGMQSGVTVKIIQSVLSKHNQ